MLFSCSVSYRGNPPEPFSGQFLGEVSLGRPVEFSLGRPVEFILFAISRSFGAKMAKRGNGEGSVSRRKGGGWRAQYVFYTSAGRQRKTIYGKTRAEVATKLAKAISNWADGLTFDAKNLTVLQYGCSKGDLALCQIPFTFYMHLLHFTCKRKEKRRGRDSNPRDGLTPPTRFPIALLRPTRTPLRKRRTGVYQKAKPLLLRGVWTSSP
jgi:hypothetical protein